MRRLGQFKLQERRATCTRWRAMAKDAFGPRARAVSLSCPRVERTGQRRVAVVHATLTGRFMPTAALWRSAALVRCCLAFHGCREILVRRKGYPVSALGMVCLSRPVAKAQF